MNPIPSVEWVDAPPPPSPKKKGGTQSWVLPVVGILSTQPGQWARVGTVARPGSFQNTFREYGCECVTRLRDGDIQVYARYVGVKP